MTKSIRYSTCLLLIGLTALSGCGESVEVSAPASPSDATVAIQVTTEGFGTQDIRSSNTFRLRVLGADGSTLREVSGAFSEDPNRTFGPFQVPTLDGPISGAFAELEIFWRVGDEQVVIWSGRSAPGTLTADTRTDLEMTVYRGALANGELTSVEISGVPTEVGIGEHFTGSASGSPSGLLSQPAWGSLDPDIASVDGSGRLTGLAEGTARIVVAAGPVSDTVAVSVRPLVESIVVQPMSLSFASLGVTMDLEATVLDFRGEVLPDEPVHWSVSSPGVVTVSQPGVVRAIANGTVDVIASAGEVSVSIPVQVAQVPAALVIRPPFATMVPGETRDFTGRVEDAGGSRIDGFAFEWSSSNPETIEVDATGRVTAGRVGEALLTLSADTLVATAEVTVEPGELAQFELVSGGDQSAEVEETLADPVVVRAIDQAGFPVPGLAVTWTPSGDGSTSSTSTLTNDDGETGVRWTLGSQRGPQTLTASSEGVTLAIDATGNVTVASIVVTPQTVSLDAIGAEQQFTAEARNAGGEPVTGFDFVWSSSDEGTVSIDAASGLALSVGTGSATISASTDGVSGTASVTVTQAPVSVEVTPGTGTVEPGETLQLDATVRDSEGVEIPGAAVSWSSLDTDLATVDISGLVTGEDEGATTIQAASGGATGTMELTITPPMPASIAIFAGDGQTAPAGLTLGDALEVQVLSAFGREVPDADVSWEPQNGGSASPTTSTTDADGLTSSSWTLGPELGTQELRAAIDGDTVTFTATASGASRVFDSSAEADQIVMDDPDGDFNFPNSDWTLSMWVRPDDLSNAEFQYAFSGGLTAFSTGVLLYIDPNLGMHWNMSARSANSGGILGSPGGAAIEGVWQHLVVRRSGTSVTLWVDGTEVPGALTVSEEIQASGTPRLGVRGDQFGEWYDGAIAQISRWSTALSGSQITDLANGTHALDLEEASRDWFLPLGRDPEIVDGGTFSVNVFGTSLGGAPPVLPPASP